MRGGWGTVKWRVGGERVVSETRCKAGLHLGVCRFPCEATLKEILKVFLKVFLKLSQAVVLKAQQSKA